MTNKDSFIHSIKIIFSALHHGWRQLTYDNESVGKVNIVSVHHVASVPSLPPTGSVANNNESLTDERNSRWHLVTDASSNYTRRLSADMCDNLGAVKRAGQQRSFTEIYCSIIVENEIETVSGFLHWSV